MDILVNINLTLLASPFVAITGESFMDILLTLPLEFLVQEKYKDHYIIFTHLRRFLIEDVSHAS